MGEGCHIVDVCRFLVGVKIKNITTVSLKFESAYYRSDDNATFTIEYEDGSIATIRYISCSADEVPKEEMRVYCDGTEIFMDNYESMQSAGINVKKIKTMESDKGQKDILVDLYNVLKTRTPSLTFDEIYETTMTTLKIRDDITKQNV